MLRWYSSIMMCVNVWWITDDVLVCWYRPPVQFWLREAFILKNHFFCDKCQTSSDPPPLRVTKNHPPFFTRKTLSEELNKYYPLGGLKVWPETLPQKFFSSKNTFWEAKKGEPRGQRPKDQPKTPPLENKKSLKVLQMARKGFWEVVIFLWRMGLQAPPRPGCDICHKKSGYFF